MYTPHPPGSQLGRSTRPPRQRSNAPSAAAGDGVPVEKYLVLFGFLKYNCAVEQKIIVGECGSVMQGIAPNCVDLTVTSPPYDNLRDYHGYSFDFEGIARELYRITKPGGVVVWVVGDATVNGSETGTSFKQALYFKEIGFNLHDTMIYQKPALSFPETNRYYPSFEYMFVLSKGKPKTFNPIADRPNKTSGNLVHGTERNRDGSTQKKKCGGNEIKPFGWRFNIWEIPNSGRAGNKHPATFPLKLAEDHIRSWSNEGDLVFDPFLGSGTTLVAAKNLNRRGFGIEISQEYASIARARIEAAEPPAPTLL